MNLTKNIFGKLKICIVGVLLVTFVSGTFVFMYYFTNSFQKKVVEGVKTVADEVDGQLKSRGVSQYENRKQLIKSEYLTRLENDNGILRQTVPSTLWNVEPDAAELIIKAFLNKEEILAVRVNDESGKLFAAMQKKDGSIVAIKEEQAFRQEGKTLSSELSKGDKKIGQVTLYYSEAPLERQLAQVDSDLASFREENTSMVRTISKNLNDTISTESSNMIKLRAIEMGVVFLFVLASITICIRLFMIKPLTRMLSQLNQSSSQIKSAAAQVSEGAEALAAVTATEAASVEETSATVQELSSMTQRNADHSRQTDQLMRDTKATVTNASTSMKSLFDSIKEIQESSVATSKIIKTIDEISFQTNILALNAAVEAARVGVHGAGFAVVAGEVRSLAQRAAEAAKDTAQLIEGTGRHVTQAAGLVEETRQRFEEVNLQVAKSSGFVTQIAEASADQARGLEQLNTTIEQIGKVVQQNAASSQSSAAASQEMNSQANSMDQVISNLSVMVGVSDKITDSISISVSDIENSPKPLPQQKRVRQERPSVSVSTSRTDSESTSFAPHPLKPTKKPDLIGVEAGN